MAEGVPVKPVAPRRTLVGACLGNAVEWYDFAIYGALSTVLARVFFPAGEQAALAATFAIFATSFLVRPVGALMVGRRSDRMGRRPALSSMIALMAVSTTLIGLLPTWSSVGVLAPLCLLLLRITQGFSAGGEVPSSVAFLIESAPEGRRGWYGGWHLASIALGLATGYGVATVLTAALSEEALLRWGWRVAFLVAAPLGLVARFIRHRLHETPMFQSIGTPVAPRIVPDVLRGRAASVGRGFALVVALALPFNLWFVFLPSHAAASGQVALGSALACGTGGLLAGALTAPLMGRLSDRVGRRPVLAAGALAVAAFAVPGFWIAGNGVIGLLVSEVVMGLLLGTLVVAAFVAEAFPTAVRATGVALAYGCATAVFGGSAPLVATVLAAEGWPGLIPAYLVVAALLAAVAVVTAEETAFRRLG